MYLEDILTELRQRLEHVKKAILILEASRLLEASRPKSGRGRKSMGDQERAMVSERMKRYWGARRVRAAGV
jgi:hypothetical protein